MKEKIIIASVISFLLIGGLAIAMIYDGDGDGLTSAEDFKVECVGTIEVDIGGLGRPSLDPVPQCEIVECGFLGDLFALSDSFSDQGEVKLIVDGSTVDRHAYRSSSANVGFKLVSECGPSPDSVQVVLTDQKGIADEIGVNV